MASLGTFGKAKPTEVVEETTFDYFGSVIHLSPLKFNELEFVDLMEKMGRIDETNPAAITLIKDMLRMLLADEASVDYAGKGFDTFWALAKANRQEIEDLMAVYTALMEATTTRPTQKPSDSSDGQDFTTDSSVVVSSSAEPSPGRPDLQVMRDDSARDKARVLAAVAAN